MRLKAAIGAVLFAALITMAVTAWNQHHALKDVRSYLSEAQDTIKRQSAAIGKMEAHATQNTMDSAEFIKTLQQVQELAGESRKIWETLKRENEEFKVWAESNLPADIIRLRRRPAITGAAGYKSWLQQSYGLHPASQPAAAE